MWLFTHPLFLWPNLRVHIFFYFFFDLAPSALLVYIMPRPLAEIHWIPSGLPHHPVFTIWASHAIVAFVNNSPTQGGFAFPLGRQMTSCSVLCKLVFGYCLTAVLLISQAIGAPTNDEKFVFILGLERLDYSLNHHRSCQRLGVGNKYHRQMCVPAEGGGSSIRFCACSMNLLPCRCT